MTNNRQAWEAIHDKIKSSNNILLTLHRGPDPDSIGSNLAMYLFLKDLGKEVDLTSVDEPLDAFSFLQGFGNIKIKDIAACDLSTYDLILILDSGSPQMLTYKESFEFSDKDFVIVIDHHKTNIGYGKINLIEGGVSSTSELVFNLLDDWGAKVEEGAATSLLTGILGDTGSFRFESAVTPDTFIVASKLLEKGARLGQAVYNLFQSTEIKTLKYWGIALDKLEIKRAGGIKFAFSAVSENELGKIERIARSGAATLFFNSVNGTEFGLLLTQDGDAIDGSLRSRTEVDVAKIAEACGGGGHEKAAGFRYPLKDKDFKSAVDDILEKVERTLG